MRFNRVLVALSAFQCLENAVALDYRPQGPQVTQVSGNQKIWEYRPAPGAPVSTYTVQSLNPKPTMWWNCDLMPSICANVRRRQAIGVTQEYVVDIEGEDGNYAPRSDARRAAAGCTSDWYTPGKCPQQGQPNFWHHSTSQMLPPTLARREGNKGIASDNDKLLQGPPKGTVDKDGNPQYGLSGIQYSCDEFPPASWIQGGQGASTYCAPIRRAAKRNCGTKTNAEQDWQGSILGSFGKRLRAYADREQLTQFQGNLFAFDFILENAGTGSGTSAARFLMEHVSTDKLAIKRSLDNATALFRYDMDLDDVVAEVLSERDEGPFGNIETTPVHQDPTEIDMIPTRIDVIEQYILAQVNASRPASRNNTNNSTNIPREAEAVHQSISPHKLLKRDALTCSASAPCVDGSCCNKEGKCGFGAGHCGSDVCVSQCQAKATCGRDSQGGNKKCGLNICCSYYGWCGTTKTYCEDPEPQFGVSPCQKGFGLCQVIPPPSCSPNGGSINGRSIAYYQSWNFRDRKCNQVLPHQIDTKGLTHLYFAFIGFDPSTFQVMFTNPADESLATQFTGLRSPTLQTWVAVGGWAFNDPGPTERAFSDMVASAANRATFISSLVRFMDRYGFQGADIDWEYPSIEKRGGREADKDNLVLLMKELRAALGTKYGLSMVLAPDYAYLSGSDPKAMEPYVDWFGFMSYDLHGVWDENVPALGKKVRPQTNISEINTGLTPLWFAGVNPAKVNLGLAYYGRTFTLSNSGCSDVNCGFATAGKPGKCTNFGGVLSNLEIQDLIKEKGLKPKFLPDAMVKQIVFDGDQWAGYDDEETFALKRQFANSLCLGGTMIWSIDFGSSGSGSSGGNPGNAVGANSSFVSPDRATIIPLKATTVPAGQTLTVSSAVASEASGLPFNGNQNSPKGPGAARCGVCDLQRLLTSTCCGWGGTVGNPIVIPANIPLPAPLILPPGFTPNQPFHDANGWSYNGTGALTRPLTIPRGFIFTAPFVLPADFPLGGEEPSANDDNQPHLGGDNSTLVWIDPVIWTEDEPTMNCQFPCILVLPPFPVSTTYTPPPITYSTDSYTTTIFPPIITKPSVEVPQVTAHRSDGKRKKHKPGPPGGIKLPHITIRLPGISTPKIIRPPPGPPPPNINLPTITIDDFGPPGPTIQPLPGSPENPDPEDPEDPDDPEFPTCQLADGDPADPLEEAPPAPSKTQAKPSVTATDIPPPVHTFDPDTPKPPAPTHLPDFFTYTRTCYTSGPQGSKDDAHSAVKEWCRRHNAPQYYLTWKDGLVRTNIPDRNGRNWLMTIEVTGKNCYVPDFGPSDDGLCGTMYWNIVDYCDRGGTIVYDKCLKLAMSPS